MARIVVGVVALLIIGMMGTVAFQAALESGGERVTIDNETWSPSPVGTATTLAESDRADAFYSNQTVVYNNDTSPPTEVDRGSDYTWNQTNGSVTAVSGGALDGVSEALIVYEFDETTKEQRDFAALLGQMPRVIGFALPFLALIVFARLIG